MDDAEIGRRMKAATYSHVDGRDLLAELQPKHWHLCNIHVRINGQWKVYEGDWLKKLLYARDGVRNGDQESGWSVLLESLVDREKGGPV